MKIRLFIILLFLLGACRTAPTATRTPNPTPMANVATLPITADATQPPRRQPTATITEFVFPDPITPTPVCPDSPPTRLILMERARVGEEDRRPLRVREGAGISFDIVAQLQTNTVFLVLEGPVCADGFTWYRIQHRNTDGWIAEGEMDFYYVEPYLTG